jgi:hypothetical protein
MPGGGATLTGNGWLCNEITPNPPQVNGHLTPYVLAQSAVPSSVTGTTSETVLATITIPANAMGPNGAVRVTSQWSYTNSANTKTTNQRFAGFQARTVPLTTTSSRSDIFLITNRNATNSQVGSSAGAGAYGTSGGTSATFSVDTTQPQNITLCGTLTNTSETITLESYIVEILNP